MTAGRSGSLEDDFKAVIEAWAHGLSDESLRSQTRLPPHGPATGTMVNACEAELRRRYPDDIWERY